MGDLGDAVHTVEIMTEAGVQGIVGLNTQKDYDYYLPKVASGDKKLFKYYTEKFNGGISGELIKERSFEQIARTADQIKKVNPDLVLIHVGGLATHKDLLKSREIAPLREWYTGFMEAIATTDLKKIYPKMMGKA